MSGKRRATNQIQRETYRDVNSSDEEGAPLQATTEALSKRKIIRPKSRLNKQEQSTPPTNAFSFTLGGAKSTKPSVEKPQNDTPSKLKALNTSFARSVETALKANPVGNLTPLTIKYKEYYQQVFQPADESSSDSEMDDIKVQGPQFTLDAPPTTKNPVFSFGAKPQEPSDSEDDIRVEGPTFTANVAKGDAFTGGFKLDVAPSTKPFAWGKADSEKPTFNFGKTEEPKMEEPKQDEPKPEKPAFTFGSSTEPTVQSTDKPSFNFGSTAQPNKPASTFGGQAEKPVSRNGSDTAPEKAADKPTFSFGKPGTKKPVSEKSETPTFTFGTTVQPEKASEKSEQPVKPAFSFASAAQTDKPVFGNSDLSEKPAFSFGSAPQSNSGNAEPESGKPAFSFGKAEASSEKPALEKPAFSFGKTEAPSEKPSFSFGKTEPSSEKPAFSFASSGKPFSFTASTSAFNTTQPTQSTQPSSAFNFSFTPADAKKEETKKEDVRASQTETADKPDEEDHVTGDYAIVQLTENAKPNEDEDEDCLYAKRSKLMLFDPLNKEAPYASKGVGELKLLKNSKSSRSRIVVRADGSGRVLLNTLLSKDVQYTTIGNGSMVRIPVIQSEGKIETYVVKVKTPADGSELLKNIQDTTS